MAGQQRSRRPSAPVSVRSMSDPRPGWTLPDAVRLAEQGYSLERVERLTGFAAAHVRGQLAPSRRPPSSEASDPPPPPRR